MSDLLKAVDSKTQLAGKNRMELLTFTLNSSKQFYGINVFKVREIYQNPQLTRLPGSHPSVIGTTHFRGRAIPIIDAAAAIGEPPLADRLDDFTIITTEFNRQMQGLLVRSVDRIINTGWEDISKPPAGARRSFIIAITKLGDSLVEVIDVECMLEQISPQSMAVDRDVLEEEVLAELAKGKILIADDSLVARKKISSALKQLDTSVVEAITGKQAWDILDRIASEGKSVSDEFLMLISDIEMPEMDGYTLTSKIKTDPRMRNFHVILHSSMSGDFNSNLIQQVGADEFIAKFQPDLFAEKVVAGMKHRLMHGNDRL